MFITHTTKGAFAKLALIAGIMALILSTLNACQSLSEVTHTLSPATTPTNASVLKQARAFWPEARLLRDTLQVAVLPPLPQATITVGGAVGIELHFSTEMPATEKDSKDVYRVQANQPGKAAATVADVMSLRLFLVNANLGTPVGTVTPYPNVGDVFTISTVGANQNILFTQVPAGNYYVCVAAFGSSMGPFTPAVNLTSLSSASIYTEGQAQCSDSGGDGAGSVNVGAAPTYTVSNSAPLSMGLLLKSATGARVELTATVTNG